MSSPEQTCPYLVVQYSPGAKKHSVGRGDMKGIFHLDPTNVPAGLTTLIEERGWNKGSYVALPVNGSIYEIN